MAKPLNLVNETLDPMPFAIEMQVIIAWLGAVLAGWDHGNGTHRVNQFESRIGVIGFVGDHIIAVATVQERGRLGHIMALPSREYEIQRIP